MKLFFYIHTIFQKKISSKQSRFSIIIAVLSLGFYISCYSSGKPTHNEIGDPWILDEQSNLSENIKTPSSVELLPDEDGNIILPQDHYKWQPEGKGLIIHTARKSKLLFPDLESTYSELTASTGLIININILRNTDIYSYRPPHRTWIALDREEFMFGNRLNFFEVTAGPSEQGIGPSRWGPFYWEIEEDFSFFVTSPSNAPQIQIKSNGDTSFEVSREKYDPPTVGNEWVNFANECKTPCPLNLWVWRPDSEGGLINKIEMEAVYIGTEKYKRPIPTITIREVEL